MTNGADQTATSGPDGPKGWMGLLDEATRREHRRHNIIHSRRTDRLYRSHHLNRRLSDLGEARRQSSRCTWLFVVAALGPRLRPETAMRLFRARQLGPGQGGQLPMIVDKLADRAGLPRPPELYVIPSSTLNSFATGTPDRSAIAVTEGLLRRMTMREIIGVVGHEMSHIRNNDLSVMTLADTMTRFVQMLSYAALVLVGTQSYRSAGRRAPVFMVGDPAALSGPGDHQRLATRAVAHPRVRRRPRRRDADRGSARPRISASPAGPGDRPVLGRSHVPGAGAARSRAVVAADASKHRRSESAALSR